MANKSKSDFVSGKLRKPTWEQYVQATEMELMERLNTGSMSETEASWHAEKEIIAMALAEKSRRRSHWYHATLLIISVLSAIAAWVAAYRC